jgi:hypothetical protein
MWNAIREGDCVEANALLRSTADLIHSAIECLTAP